MDPFFSCPRLRTSEPKFKTLKVSSVELGGKCGKAPPPQIAERRLKSTSPRKEPFSSSAGNKAAAGARWLLLWVTLVVPSCEVAPPPGPRSQRPLPTAKYIINLGVMPAWAFIGHPSPRMPLTPRTSCHTMARDQGDRTRQLCPRQRKRLWDGVLRNHILRSLQPSKSPAAALSRPARCAGPRWPSLNFRVPRVLRGMWYHPTTRSPTVKPLPVPGTGW